MALTVHIFCLILMLETGAMALQVIAKSNGPAVRGSKINVTATVIGYNGENLKFKYWDDADPSHKDEFILSSNISVWTVHYPKDLYEAGDYTVYVELQKKFYFTDLWYNVASANTSFKLTETLNGILKLSQNTTERPNTFVAVNQTVTHHVELPLNEMEFLNDNASSVVTYWFIDCMYIDQTADMSLNYTYTDTMKNHLIDVLVVANNEPLPPITTTTTTTTPKPTTSTSKPTTSTSKPTTSTSKPTTSTSKPTTSTSAPATTQSTNSTDLSNSTVHKVSKRAAKRKGKKFLAQDAICQSTGIVPIGDQYTYGHYKKTISVREPILSVNITGMNWLQHGDLMNLKVKYAGSPPFDYCAEYKMGQYNITGNETCGFKSRINSNEFPLVHYFSDSEQHTVVVIIENEVGKTVSKAAINIYKVSVHSQLSVIVVPVVFCLLAVILVVFGVAYYQHRSRYTVEVADFDFGQQARLDYKTFKERLRDSFRNAFNFGQHDDTDPLTTNTNRYNTME